MQPTLLHGECVSIGMVKGAEVARALGLCTPATVGRIVRCLKSYRLPVSMPDVCQYRKCTAEVVLHRMQYDKKNTKGTIRCVLISAIGKVELDSDAKFSHAVDPELLLRILSPGVSISTRRRLGGDGDGGGGGGGGGGKRQVLSCRKHFTVPGSKSLSNRLLLLAGLSSESGPPCRLRGLLQSDDTDVMMSALEKLGLATFVWENDELLVRGTGGKFWTSNATARERGCSNLYMGNAGTATRFIQSIMMLSGRSGTPSNPYSDGVTITGSSRALDRPQGPLVEALRNHGCDLQCVGREGHLPILAREHGDGRGLAGGVLRIEGKVSSQFVSSILLAAPYADEPLAIVLAESGRPTSSTYIDMTVSCMALFGVVVQRSITKEGNVRFDVPTGVYSYCGGSLEGRLDGGLEGDVCRVECDASSATYPLAMAAVTKSTVVVHGVGDSSVQGDAGFVHLLETMGCAVMTTKETTQVTGPSLVVPDSGSGSNKTGLIAVEVDMSDLTDAFMTAVAVAVFASGTTKIFGISNQHVKECDRIAAMCENLARIGITARNNADGIEVDGIGDRSWEGERMPLLLLELPALL